MKVTGIKETINRNGEIQEYTWEVRNIGGNDYECIDLGFRFNAETGHTSKGKRVKIGETFKSGCREITYTLIVEEETAIENPTTLTEEWKREDGTIEEKNTYTGRIWEKNSLKRLYLDNHNKGAYVDLNKGTFHPDKRKSYPVGEWIKEWSAKVEYRFVLR